jgi:7-cyano-7-deazaguanine synthase
MTRAVTLLSGGLDSTTLAYHLKKDFGYDLTCLSFNYGQRHKKELQAAQELARLLDAEWNVIYIGVNKGEDDYIKSLGSILGDSVLVNTDKAVPDGHYADDNMKQTVVPNRNAIMLSIAYGVALAQQADLVAFAAHAGDHRIYPDCRPEFVRDLNNTFQLGSAWEPSERLGLPRVTGPFLEKTKGDIAALAYYLGVPIEKTWSCYKGGEIHCGTCGTCYERREAFEEANVPDPTEYLDNRTHFEAPVGV